MLDSDCGKALTTAITMSGISSIVKDHASLGRISLLVLLPVVTEADVTDFFAKDSFGGVAVFFGGGFLAGADSSDQQSLSSFALVIFRVRAANFWHWVCLGISVALT